MLEILSKPWPWYVAGPLIGLIVPLLLLTGNKTFGISSSLRHTCAILFPSNISYFKYDWRKEKWNLIFVAGIFFGALISMTFLSDGQPIIIDKDLTVELAGYGITDFSKIYSVQLMNWETLLTLKGLLMIVGGGFMIGFGTRYAGGCTSGHSITGLSMLQWPSLIATICFMIGGFISANLILPFILSL